MLSNIKETNLQKKKLNYLMDFNHETNHVY